jgi:hypothetical protein
LAAVIVDVPWEVTPTVPCVAANAQLVATPAAARPAIRIFELRNMMILFS